MPRQFTALSDALASAGIPVENRKLIESFAAALGARRYELTTGYVKAERDDGGPVLRIASGWSNGFVSQQEAMRFVSESDTWPSPDRPGLWGITHPVNGGGRRPDRASRPEPEPDVCPDCRFARSISGACEC